MHALIPQDIENLKRGQPCRRRGHCPQEDCMNKIKMRLRHFEPRNYRSRLAPSCKIELGKALSEVSHVDLIGKIVQTNRIASYCTFTQNTVPWYEFAQQPTQRNQHLMPNMTVGNPPAKGLNRIVNIFSKSKHKQLLCCPAHASGRALLFISQHLPGSSLTHVQRMTG